MRAIGPMRARPTRAHKSPLYSASYAVPWGTLGCLSTFHLTPLDGTWPSDNRSWAGALMGLKYITGGSIGIKSTIADPSFTTLYILYIHARAGPSTDDPLPREPRGGVHQGPAHSDHNRVPCGTHTKNLRLCMHKDIHRYTYIHSIQFNAVPRLVSCVLITITA